MAWDVEYTDEFEDWWETLDEDEQMEVAASVGLLEEKGPTLPFPHSSGINGSNFGEMRELRIQYKGDPYRVLYAFDPRRTVNKGHPQRFFDLSRNHPHVSAIDKCQFLNDN